MYLSTIRGGESGGPDKSASIHREDQDGIRMGSRLENVKMTECSDWMLLKIAF